MTVTVWILLMLWQHDPTKDGEDYVRNEAKYLAFYSEKECEDEKKAFIIRRVNEAAKRNHTVGGERSFSATCSSITAQAQK